MWFFDTFDSKGFALSRVSSAENHSLIIRLRTTRGRILFALVVLAGIAPVVYHAYCLFRSDRLVQREQTIGSYSRAIEYDPGNGALWWYRGRLRQYNIDSPDIPGAIRDYETALSLNPRIGQAWVDLADCYERSGNLPKAEESLQNALRVWTYSPLIRWQAGNFYLLRGNLEKMYECFKMACDYDTSKLGIAMQIAWKADSNHTEIGQKLIPDRLPARLLYLDFLVAHDEPDLAIEAWERSLPDPVPAGFQYHVSAVFALIDRLLAKNRVEDALRVWKEALQKADESSTDSRFVWEGAGARPAEPSVNLVWNGSFEDEILGGGFDWRYSATSDVESATDLSDRFDGLRSLKLTFGGTNINFSNLRQVVPVLVPGNYLLEFYAKTQNLTTDQRPYILIQGVPETQAATLNTGAFPESSPWQKYSFPFTVTAGAKALEIVLRRDPSQKFGNQLKGSLWLDKVSIRAQDQPSSVHDPRSHGSSGGEPLKTVGFAHAFAPRR
jgi:hypothetical protein